MLSVFVCLCYKKLQNSHRHNNNVTEPSCLPTHGVLYARECNKIYIYIFIFSATLSLFFAEEKNDTKKTRVPDRVWHSDRDYSNIEINVPQILQIWLSQINDTPHRYAMAECFNGSFSVIPLSFIYFFFFFLVCPRSMCRFCQPILFIHPLHLFAALIHTTSLRMPFDPMSIELCIGYVRVFLCAMQMVKGHMSFFSFCL